MVGDPETAVRSKWPLYSWDQKWVSSVCSIPSQLLMPSWQTCFAGTLLCHSKNNSVEKPLYLEPPCGDFLHYQSFLTITVFAIESIFFLLLISANHIGNILGILNPFYMPLESLRVLLLFSASMLHLAIKNSECGWFFFSTVAFFAYRSNRSVLWTNSKTCFIIWKNARLETKCVLIVIFIVSCLLIYWQSAYINQCSGLVNLDIF